MAAASILDFVRACFTYDILWRRDSLQYIIRCLSPVSVSLINDATFQHVGYVFKSTLNALLPGLVCVSVTCLLYCCHLLVLHRVLSLIIIINNNMNIPNRFSRMISTVSKLQKS